MGDKSQPVFRDFLGAGLRVTAKQPEFSVTDSMRFSRHSGGLAGCEDGEVSTRACSTYSSGSAPAPFMAAAPKDFLNSSERNLESWQLVSKGPGKFFSYNDMAPKGSEHPRGSKRTPSPIHSPLREPLLLNKNCSEAFQSSKVSPFPQRESDVGGSLSSSPEDLSLIQPPGESSCPASIWLQTSVFKADLTTGSSKRVKCSKSTVLNLASSSGAVAAPLLCGSFNQGSKSGNTASGSLLCQVPGDEGSRTGRCGSELAMLLKASTPEMLPGLPKASPFLPPLNLAAGDASAVPTCSHEISAPVSRSLTVFYGGQAHVFDDVPPEKVDAIMMLAGSNGRSWSTVYVPRGSVDEFSSGNDRLLTNASKQKDAGRYKAKKLSYSPHLSETLVPNPLQG